MNINRKGLKITTVNEILQDINNLDTSKRIELFKELGLVEHTDYADISDYVSKKRLRDGYVCPHCGSLHIVRYGKSKGAVKDTYAETAGKRFLQQLILLSHTLRKI